MVDEWLKITTQRPIEDWMPISGNEAEFTEIIDG